MKTLCMIFLGLFLFAGAVAQDTTKVVFYGDDNSYSVSDKYQVMDAYGDTLTTDESDNWMREVCGYIITDDKINRCDSVNLCYRKLDESFKVFTTVPFTGFAPRYDYDQVIDTNILGSKPFYYQTQGYLK